MIDCIRAAALLREWDDILILCHASPDGDALGSASALLRGLRSLGKRAWFACADQVDEKFAYLFAGLTPPAGSPAHVVSVDVAATSLLGGLEEEYQHNIELAIDHHGSHSDFARESWVEPKAAAACELVYLLLKELGVNIDKSTAGCLYTGLTTDTGCFRYSNVTPRTHRIAAELLELGADAAEINRKMFESKSRAQIEAERIIMESMAFSCEGRCAMVQVPHSIYERTGAREGELEGIATLPRQIEGVVLAITVKEKEDGTIKASVRSNPPVSACALCEKFGGGGHQFAAGCSFEGESLAGVVQKLSAAAAELLS